ncbi:hypothetical protein NH340_JMT02925 [Sarcoptes scabiei]|nr:hypothetical protein NH340_JMT02925 [Sarcoptes scabiei]
MSLIAINQNYPLSSVLLIETFSWFYFIAQLFIFFAKATLFTYRSFLWWFEISILVLNKMTEINLSIIMNYHYHHLHQYDHHRWLTKVLMINSIVINFFFLFWQQYIVAVERILIILNMLVRTFYLIFSIGKQFIKQH